MPDVKAFTASVYQFGNTTCRPVHYCTKWLSAENSIDSIPLIIYDTIASDSRPGGYCCRLSRSTAEFA